MSDIGGLNFTNFQNVRVKGTGGAAGVVRFANASGYESTLYLSANAEASTNVHTLTAIGGGIGRTGTFAVTLQAVTSWAETAVTVSGIRREDAVLCQIQDMGATVTTGRTFPIISGVRPENGYLYITFYNPTGTATLYAPMTLAYTAFR